jgi:hypothetical protein
MADGLKVAQQIAAHESSRTGFMIDAAMMLAWTRWSGSQFDERFTQDLSGLGKMDVFAVVVSFSSGDSETGRLRPEEFHDHGEEDGSQKNAE